jgi:hypothetical protein
MAGVHEAYIGEFVQGEDGMSFELDPEV